MADFYLDVFMRRENQWYAIVTAPDGRPRLVKWNDYRFDTEEQALEAATELFKQGANGDDRLIDYNDHTVIYVDRRGKTSP